MIFWQVCSTFSYIYTNYFNVIIVKSLIQETKFNKNQRKHALKLYTYTTYESDSKGNISLAINRLIKLKPKPHKEEGIQPLNDLHVYKYSAYRIFPLLVIVIIMTPQLYIYSPSSYLTFYMQSNPPFLPFNSCTADCTKQQRKCKKRLCERMEEYSLSLNLVEVVIPPVWQIIMYIPSNENCNISKMTINRLIFKKVSLISFFIRNLRHTSCLKGINYFIRELG